MAVTSIWAIKNNLKQVLDYTSNPEKTTRDDLEDVLTYAANDLKTEQKQYVTGVNCDPDTAYTPVTEDILKDANVDTVIIATGSKPFAPNIEGIERAVSAEDVLYGNTELPFGPVVVCGGGEVGGETAEFIAANMMLPVTILEMQPNILNEMCFQNKVPLLGLLAQRQVQVITNAKVSKVSENTVTYTAADGSCQTIPAVSVVSAFGYKAYNPLEEIAKKYCDDVKVIGSAIKAGNAMTAIQEGYQAALNL